MLTLSLALSVVVLAGCTGAGFYTHDQALEERLKKARDQFAELTTGQVSVWATMQANLDAAAHRESEALRRDAANQRAATIAAIDSLTWNDVKRDTDAIAAAATQTLEDLKTRISETIDVVERYRAKTKKDTSASGEQDQDTGAKANAAKNAVRKLDTADDALAMKNYLGVADDFIASVREHLGPLLHGRGQVGLRRLLAVARKAKDQELVKTIPDLVDNVAGTLKEPSKVPLPEELQKAAKRYLKQDFSTFGQLLDFFTAKDTANTDVPLTLEAEFERMLMEIRQAELKFLEERLRLLNARLIVERQRRIWAKQVAQQAETKIKRNGRQEVKDSLEEWRKNNDGEFHTGLLYLVRYVQLQGSLNTWSKLIANDLALLDHRERVRLDEIATSAHARLASLGLQGVTSFAEGGITEEQVANWLRAFQTAGIAVIGARVD